MGIHFQHAGGTIKNNTVQNQILPDGHQGCQDGERLFVENPAAGTGKITIAKNTITNFNKNGITLSFSAASGEISGNTGDRLRADGRHRPERHSDWVGRNGQSVEDGDIMAITAQMAGHWVARSS